MQKLAPSSLEILTYTTDTVKIVGSCTFFLVHVDTKKLMEVTFYVAMNNGSVLLSCKTTLMLGLIHPRTRLDYLLSRANLITSSADHPKKTKTALHIQEARGVCSHNYANSGCSNTKSQKRSPQATNKQRSDSVWVPRCFSGDWYLPRTILSHSEWSKCCSQANTLPPNPCTSQRSVQARNKQDVTGRRTCTSQWNYTLDQQLCPGWKQGQIRESQIMHLLWSS